MKLTDLSADELNTRQSELLSAYTQFKEARLSLDLTRGKPCAEQLDLSNDLDGILEGFFLLQNGTDVRNYGGILGVPEARQMGADILGLQPAQVMVGGNSSLTLMYNMIAHMAPQWDAEAREINSKVKFLCPVPGYDRHFTICESFDIEMINVDLLSTGPDMTVIENLLAQDPMIKGIWCVPKYSNPTGHTYDEETVKRFAQLGKIAGRNFRIMWDNAYVAHHLTDNPARLHDLMDESMQAGTEDNLVMLASTSKITFAGAGISFLGTSEKTLAAFEKFLTPQVIGFDKVNQLRHVRFLQDGGNLAEHMNKHRTLLGPKFEMVQNKLQEALGDKGIAEWTRPEGGYFISLDTLPGIASKVIKFASDAGVKLTPAGATYPYGMDPENRNIRIAPTFPSLTDLEKALNVLVVCLELASADHLLSQ
ncbi:MAG: aminotransferase [Gammaproteobacteria bacterium]|jgi:aspartate/methionine/tyrosine aminotransferase|nr:aminotransferase [Gammaproteobacteria bacterium]|tara:strand:+ start:20458 stop:21726 length:1269 start_codon:yes stop_codon:yes gene_type:complete